MALPTVTTVSYSFVMIFSKWVALPIIDEIEAKSLFGRPDKSMYTADLNGIIVQEPLEFQQIVNEVGQLTLVALAKARPSMTIGPNKLQISAPSMEMVFEVIKKLSDMLNKKEPNFIPSVATAQLGVNLEYEIALDNQLGIEWMKVSSLKNIVDDHFTQVIPAIYQFQLTEDSLQKNMHVEVQPRAGKPKSLFLAVNDHYGISPIPGFADESQLKTYFTKAEEKFRQQVVPLLFNN